MAEDSLIRVVLGQEPLVAGQGKPDAISIARAKEAKAMAAALRRSEAISTSGWDTSKKWMSKTLGINITTSAILKQSQIFTSFMGTIFQLFGALVDVILAPFLPILIPIIRIIGAAIPIIHRIMQDHIAPRILGLVKYAEGFFQWSVDFWKSPSWGKLWDAMPSIALGFYNLLPDWFARGMTPLIVTNLGKMMALFGADSFWLHANPFKWLTIAGHFVDSLISKIPGSQLITGPIAYFFEHLLQMFNKFFGPMMKHLGMEGLGKRMATSSAKFLVEQAKQKALKEGGPPGVVAKATRTFLQAAIAKTSWGAVAETDIMKDALRKRPPMVKINPTTGLPIQPEKGANWFTRQFNKLPAGVRAFIKSPTSAMVAKLGGRGLSLGLSSGWSFMDAFKEGEHGAGVQMMHALKGIGLGIATPLAGMTGPLALPLLAGLGAADVMSSNWMKDQADKAKAHFEATGETSIWHRPDAGFLDQLNITFQDMFGDISQMRLQRKDGNMSIVEGGLSNYATYQQLVGPYQ